MQLFAKISGAVLTAGLLFSTSTMHAAELTKRVVLKDADGKIAGSAMFTQKKDGLHIHVIATGLAAGDHAVHIHATPKCEGPDFMSAGGHFNPAGKKHGIKNPDGHHNGDLPANLTVAVNGSGTVDFVSTDLTLDPKAANSLYANGGTSIMIHEKADDMVTDPTGSAGKRVACGVITAE